MKVLNVLVVLDLLNCGLKQSGELLYCLCQQCALIVWLEDMSKKKRKDKDGYW